MLFKDQTAFVKQHIKKNKMRVFMTVLAATIGCAFLIVLASVGFGIQKTLENEILSDELVTRVQLYNPSVEGLTDDEIKDIESREHINTVLRKSIISGDIIAQYEDRMTHTNAEFVDFKNYANANKKLSAGTMPTKANEILVGYHFANGLLTEQERKTLNEERMKPRDTPLDMTAYGYKGEIIGKEIPVQVSVFNENDEEITTQEQMFKIVGITEKPGYEWATNEMIIMPVNAMQKMMADLQKQHVVDENLIQTETEIYVDSLENVLPLVDELKEDGYNVYSQLEQLKQLNVFFLVFKIGLIFVGTIAVLISSIGIFNTMTMAVTERTREIGVMKAIGASPKLIQRLFLMESALIGVMGTVIAVILSYVISFAVNLVLPIILKMATGEEEFMAKDMIFSSIPWQLVVVASIISIGVAMISGWRPARKATKIDVIQALRQEL